MHWILVIMLFACSAATFQGVTFDMYSVGMKCALFVGAAIAILGLVNTVRCSINQISNKLMTSISMCSIGCLVLVVPNLIISL